MEVNDPKMSERYSVCDNPTCPNQGRAANHPRSGTSKICGVCQKPVRVLSADRKREEVIE